MMESLNEAIQKRMNSMGTARAVNASMIIDQANRVLPPQVRATTWRAGTLTVVAARSVDAHFFKEEKETYLEELNAALHPIEVKSIVIRTNHIKT